MLKKLLLICSVFACICYSSESAKNKFADMRMLFVDNQLRDTKKHLRYFAAFIDKASKKSALFEHLIEQIDAVLKSSQLQEKDEMLKKLDHEMIYFYYPYSTQLVQLPGSPTFMRAWDNAKTPQEKSLALFYYLSLVPHEPKAEQIEKIADFEDFLWAYEKVHPQVYAKLSDYTQERVKEILSELKKPLTQELEAREKTRIETPQIEK